MKKIAAVVFVLISIGAEAQQKIDLTVRQVNDRRTTGGFFNNLSIAVELPKLKSAEIAASRVFITSATDDSGRDLRDPEASEPQFELNSRAMMPDAPPMPATITLTLENPDRKATKVKEVRGEIELYMPSKDPNSVAEIPKFTTMSGKAISHKALKANGVEISMVSPAQAEAERKRRAEAKKKEYAEIGYEGEALADMVKSLMEGVLGVEESDLLVKIKDPNKRIQDINYIDGAGEVKMVSMREDEGFVILSTWGGKPEADWKLKVNMKTPKSLARYQFALSDVPLP